MRRVACISLRYYCILLKGHTEGEHIMSHFARGLSVSIVATLFASGVIVTPTHAEVSKISQADKKALAEATTSCKAEAKGKKIRWPSSREIFCRRRSLVRLSR